MGWFTLARHYDDLDAGNEWGTPAELVTPLADAVGGFDLDPAAGAEPEPYADSRYTYSDDGLSSPWYGRVWLNPPYGRKHNRAWGERTTDAADNDDVTSITALVPASTGTAWFGETYATADALTFIHERLSFIDAASVSDDETANATFGSVIASFGDFPDGYWTALDALPYATTTYRHPD